MEDKSFELLKLDNKRSSLFKLNNDKKMEDKGFELLKDAVVGFKKNNIGYYFFNKDKSQFKLDGKVYKAMAVGMFNRRYGDMYAVHVDIYSGPICVKTYTWCDDYCSHKDIRADCDCQSW